MRDSNNEFNNAQTPLISLSDIYYTLFRNKVKIILCGVLGVIAGAGLYLRSKPTYSSEARLFLRYVERATTAATLTEDARNRNADVQLLSTRTDGIIASELQILTSRDLIQEAVNNVGPEKFIEDPSSIEEPSLIPTIAANIVLGGLSVSVPRGSTIVSISYESGDPNLVQPVLQELIDVYLERHHEIHRSSGEVLDSFLARQTDKYRAQLNQTEEDLRREMAKAGIDSVESGSDSKLSQLQRIREDIFNTQAELAEREATLQEYTANLTTSNSESSEETHLPQRTNPNLESEYQILQGRLASLREQESSLLVQFTEESVLVKDIRNRIIAVESEISDIEASHPIFSQVSSPISGIPSAQAIDPLSESARIAALRSRLNVLNSQKELIQSELDRATEGEIVINELLRRLELEESNYSTFLRRLEQERINESFGSGKVNGINIAQSPTPPMEAPSKAHVLAAGASVGGLLFGLAWAFAIELYLDRSIRRPQDIKKAVSIPLFLAIPDEKRRLKKRITKAKGKQKILELYFDEEAHEEHARKANNRATSALDINRLSRDITSPLYPYYEALRDRLVGFFESRNLTHSPKLIGLTGLGESPGVTTLAAGLASCLSKTEDGNVLLVDMTLGQESSRQYSKGKEICDLDEALETNESAQIEGNLYVVKETSKNENTNLPRLLPKRFNHIVPKLKASDFDYIIFDMPEVSPISVTPRLAGYMDAMLMVVESEKTDSSVLKQATQLMEQSNSNLGVVLNKTKQHAPKFLQEEFFGTS